MQLTIAAATFLSVFSATAYGHAAIVDPPPLRGRLNPNVQNPDFNMVAPLDKAGSNFPCKGYQVDLGTPAGASVITYNPGQSAAIQLEGLEAAHNGGSCQISLSFDGGVTFKVIKSFIGNCVRSVGGNVFDQNQSYDFTIPAEARAGPVLLSWSWFNQSGDREMYQNCVSATIAGSGASTLDGNPDMFVANVGNGCATTEGTDVEFPNPGGDVSRNNAFNGSPTGPPVGNCPAGGGAPAPAPVPAPPAEVIVAPSGSTHTVQSGDFCESIAAARGVSIGQLLALNPSIDPACSNLQVGQVLNLRRRSRIMRNYKRA